MRFKLAGNINYTSLKHAETAEIFTTGIQLTV